MACIPRHVDCVMCITTDDQRRASATLYMNDKSNMQMDASTVMESLYICSHLAVLVFISQSLFWEVETENSPSPTQARHPTISTPPPLHRRNLPPDSPPRPQRSRALAAPCSRPLPVAGLGTAIKPAALRAPFNRFPLHRLVLPTTSTICSSS